MKAFLIIYMDNFKVYKCVLGADSQEQAISKAENKNIKNIVSVQDIEAYILV